jgi:DNA sulfur modification protein DndB
MPTTEFCKELSLAKSNELKSIYKKRTNHFIYETIKPELFERYKTENWLFDKKNQHTIRIKKLKPFDEIFEDSIWCMFQKMGFTEMNKDRNFKLSYSDENTLMQQIDIFAADSETILIVKCKASDEQLKKASFKETIEAIGGKKEGLLRTIRASFPEAKHKIKFIFATNNYIINENDQERLRNYDIIHFDDEVISYYIELTKHLGTSARFQLQGFLFSGQNVPELDTRVPAIQGKIGGHTFYSFSIEPEKLLKISYVLHRNNANKKMMPTYQRIIKKSRLIIIKQFLDNGGFFPNSIVINIVSNCKKIRFDIASPQIESALSKIGILYLPQTYRSAYIIDGQHRLYAYGESEYKSKHTIPVVAFVDLEREEQIRLFMQINENQKAVSKNLQNTLNSDLLWDSPNLLEQIKALKLQIEQSLGEDFDSPLHNRVIIGEAEKNRVRCISIETIKTGLDRSNFFGEFTRNSIKVDGTFYKGNNDSTLEYILPF